MKTKVQAFGRFLSGMVMPNISAFIAWGLITALFIPTGWLILISGQTVPDGATSFFIYGFDIVAITETIVGPMIKYMLPLLIAYSGGKIVYGQRGGVIGVIAAMGAVASAEIPMFLGAMITGPSAACLLREIDKFILPKVKAGFEMLVNNYSAGILGMIFALIAYFIIGPVVTTLTTVLGNGVQFLVDRQLIFLTSIIVEPAKVLFLNNAINHGVFTPLGTTQVQETGKSMLFLIEANPGPGLGILLAFTFFGKGSAKTTAAGASIIHFFGGIHEIYFPYILMKPKMILAAIAGGMVGVATLNILDAGLTAPASPGSIIAVLTMTAAGDQWKVLISVILAASVSFIVAAGLLKADKSADTSFEDAQAQIGDMKAESKGSNIDEPAEKRIKEIKKIIVACDAGMGSSAMGATMLRNKLKENNLQIEVINTSIDRLKDEECDMIITQITLADRAQQNAPNIGVRTLNNFLDPKFYEELVKELK